MMPDEKIECFVLVGVRRNRERLIIRELIDGNWHLQYYQGRPVIIIFPALSSRVISGSVSVQGISTAIQSIPER